MVDVLVRIKRAVLAGRYAFSEKAFMEMDADRITKQDIVESILNAVAESVSDACARTAVCYSEHEPGWIGNLHERKARNGGGTRHLLLPGFVETGLLTEKTNMDICHCPTCGSDKIKKLHGAVSHEFEGETYTVRGVTYHQCSECGERVYDGEAVAKMQAASPAFGGALSAR